MNEILDAALDYQQRFGWSLVPMSGKKPTIPWRGFQDDPADEKTLRRLFSRPNITGLAVITGAASGGLAIRDWDQREAYHEWANANPDDAAIIPTVQTARGFHVYGVVDQEMFADLGDGELRADCGHYTVLPPSIHPDGHTYRWTVPLAKELPKLPDSVK